MNSTPSVSGSRSIRNGSRPARRRLGRFIALLALFDLSIWSYVAVATLPLTPPTGLPVTVALQPLHS